VRPVHFSPFFDTPIKEKRSLLIKKRKNKEKKKEKKKKEERKKEKRKPKKKKKETLKKKRKEKMEFGKYVDKKIAEIDAAVEAATCKRRTALGVHYAMYAPQLVLNALITGTSLVDVGMFDETTVRRIIGFTGIAIACLQALSAGFGLHRRATELSTHRRALVLLRNEFDLASTRENNEIEQARLCALFASTMGSVGAYEPPDPGPVGPVGPTRSFGLFRREAGEAGEAERSEEVEAGEAGEAERSEEVEAVESGEAERSEQERSEQERSEQERSEQERSAEETEDRSAERSEQERSAERSEEYMVTIAVC
jgi:hypothetical protein